MTEEKQTRRKVFWENIFFIYIPLALFAMLFIPQFIPPRRIHHLNSCIANLKEIDGAKEQWALDFHKTTNNVPAWTDLIGTDKYIKDTPVCPGGGSYQLNKIGESPTCSIGGTHVLRP